MAAKLLGKKVDRKRLGFMALAFSVLFCASSVQVHRGKVAENKAQEAATTIFVRMPEGFREVGKLEVLYLSTHGAVSDKYIHKSIGRVMNKYDLTLAVLAHEVAYINKDNKAYNLALYVAPNDAHVIEASLTNSWDDYFYDRLLLEKRYQEGRLSSSSHEKAMRLLAQAYAAKLPKSEVTSDEESLRQQLGVAEQQITQMQIQVNSLKEQLARAELAKSEKWIAIIIAILSVLVALSSNVIAWRTDRRQTREAELVKLKRLELEKNIIQKDRQISESNGRIIIPNPHELQLYARAVLVDNFEPRKGS